MKVIRRKDLLANRAKRIDKAEYEKAGPISCLIGSFLLLVFSSLAVVSFFFITNTNDKHEDVYVQPQALHFASRALSEPLSIPAEAELPNPISIPLTDLGDGWGRAQLDLFSISLELPLDWQPLQLYEYEDGLDIIGSVTAVSADRLRLALYHNTADLDHFNFVWQGLLGFTSEAARAIDRDYILSIKEWDSLDWTDAISFSVLQGGSGDGAYLVLPDAEKVIVMSSNGISLDFTGEFLSSNYTMRRIINSIRQL